jgi:desampylase
MEEMLAHARAESPRECCGLLIGTPLRVDRAVPCANLRASDTAYLIDPAEHFAAIRVARTAGQSVVGAYHSHPRSEALPSATDLAESVGPDFLYVIAAQAARDGWRAGAFLIDGGNFRETPLVPVA